MSPDSPDSNPKFGWLDLGRVIWHFLGRKNRGPYIFWTFTLALTALYNLVPAYLFGKVITFFGSWKPGDSLAPVFWLGAILGFSSAVVAQLRLSSKRQLAGLQIDIAYAARVEGFSRLMQFPLYWHAQENTGNKMQRIQNGVANLRNILKVLGSGFLPTFIPFIATAVIFIYLDWRLAIFTIAYILIAGTNEWWFYRHIRKANDDQNIASEKSTGTSFEGANNILTVKALGAGEAMIAAVTAREEVVRIAAFRGRHLGIAKWQWFQALNGLAYFIFVVLLALKFQEGGVAIGLLVTYFTYFRNLIDGVSNGSDMISDFTEFISAIGRMMPIYWDPIPPDRGTKKFPEDWQELRLDELSFRYPGQDHMALDDVTVVVKRGEKVGIAGSSGSGKSTLTKLLLGLHEPSLGQIVVDDTPLDSIRHEERVRNISIVLQETELLNLSLLENMTLKKKVPKEVIEQALHISCLEEVVERLPQHLDTLIGEKGYRLSGGERQRLGIARAICAQTDILILDEATSHLDSKTEAIIQERLESELGDKTLVMIAHRLSTLRSTNQIYVFKHGKVVEEGKFDDLIKTESEFGRMYHLQAGEK